MSTQQSISAAIAALATFDASTHRRRQHSMTSWPSTPCARR